MSNRKKDLIWQHEKVLPYLFGELKENIDRITPVQQIYLYGSRARVPFEQWYELDGKDWDVLVICKFPIVNTRIWTTGLNYYIDLKITDLKGAKNFFEYNPDGIELFPVNHLHL